MYRIHLTILWQGHLYRFLVRLLWIVPEYFSRAPGVGRSLACAKPACVLVRFSSLRHFPDLPRLNGMTVPLPLAGSVTPAKAYHNSAGILTCFPFGQLVLDMPLGSTNPQLTNIAEEPWPLRRPGFSPGCAATKRGILVRTCSTGPHDPASTHARRLPTTNFRCTGSRCAT